MRVKILTRPFVEVDVNLLQHRDGRSGGRLINLPTKILPIISQGTDTFSGVAKSTSLKFSNVSLRVLNFSPWQVQNQRNFEFIARSCKKRFSLFDADVLSKEKAGTARRFRGVTTSG